MRYILFYLILPFFMIGFFGSLWLYGIYGEHKIYNASVFITGKGFEDGDPMLITQDFTWYEYKIKNSTMKDFIHLKTNRTINVTVSENVYGDKYIIDIQEDNDENRCIYF
jgi:hypothetical protein